MPPLDDPTAPVDPVDPFDPAHRPPPRTAIRAALGALAIGLAVLAVTLVAVRASVPEWRTGELPKPSRVADRFLELARAAEIDVVDPRPQLRLTRGFEAGPANPYRILGPDARSWLLREHRQLLVVAGAEGTTAEGVPVYLTSHLDLDGRPWMINVTRSNFIAMFTPQWEVALPTPEELLLRPGERLGEPESGLYNGNMSLLYPLAGASGELDQHVAASQMENAPAVVVSRIVGSIDEAGQVGIADWVTHVVGRGVALVLGSIALLVLAFVLAIRRRIDFSNALLLAVVATAASLLTAVATGLGYSFEWLGGFFTIAFDAVFLFLLWATAESLLRDAGGEPVHALDRLRRGRIDRSVGLAAIWGLGAGAVLAALPLLAHALPGLLRESFFADGFLPMRASVLLPLFEPGRTPFDLGFRLTGEALLVLALAHRVLPRPWVTPAAVVAGALWRTVGTRDVMALWAEALIGIGVMAIVLLAYRRAGTLAALFAGLAAYLFPAALFSAQNAVWLTGPLAASAATLAALGALGFVGLARGERPARAVERPAFLTRLETERRMRYEMDLLARMQLGLLPRTLPEIPGWRLAARSMVAHEVGGDFYDFLRDEAGHLWVAAGDVAGHGSFCSISHAMTKASLASLVSADRTPAQVLAETDRVLRTLDARRIFTSLALLRIEPATGDALFANAGYPYPLVRQADGAVREVELPGLPLGQGPARHYTDVPLRLAPGEALILTSDGLVEASTPDGGLYGFERFRKHLGELAPKASGAEALLQALLARWRDAVGDGPIEDDTTVVVVRREG